MTRPILVNCPVCAGYGAIGVRIDVYEHGCGFSHPDVDEKPCPECEGTGGILTESERFVLEDM
jgi:hypothetical protein